MIKPSSNMYVRFFTYNASGALTDADAPGPAGVLVKNGTDTAETVTISKLATGTYKAVFAIPADAVTGDIFEVQITVVMGGVTQKDIIWRDSVDEYNSTDLNTAISTVSGFQAIIPPQMLVPTSTYNVYLLVTIVNAPDDSEVGINLLNGDNAILYEDGELTTPLSDSITFEDYKTMVSLNASIYLCYIKIDNTESADQINYVFTYAKNSEAHYHTACTSLRKEDSTVSSILADVITASSIKTDAITEIQSGLATGTDLSTVDGIVDAIKLKTDSLNFTGTDVKATLDSEKVVVSSLDNDVITAASIKTDAITEIQSGLATSLEVGTIDTNVDTIISTLGTPTLTTLANDIQAISASVVEGVPTNITAGSATLTTGTLISGTYASTLLDDGSYYTLAPVNPGGLDVYLEFTAESNQFVNTVFVNGRFSGNGRFANVYAYNWITSAWEQLSDSVTRMNHSTTDLSYNYNLFAHHQQDTTNLVRIRFQSTSTTTADRLYLDQVLVRVNTAGATAAQIADAVYFRMRYTAYNGAVWVDTEAGFSGDDVGINGLPTHPVDNMVDALSLANSLGVKKLIFSPDSVISLSQDFSDWILQGKAIIDVNSQLINDTYFIDSEMITGTAGGDDALFINCVIEDLITGPCRLNSCILQKSFTALSAGNYLIDRCSRGIVDPYLNVNITETGTLIAFRIWSGVIKVNNLTSGSQISLDGYGKLIIGSNCTGGLIKIRGNFDISDEVVGGFLGTVEDTARMAEDQNVYSVTGSVDSVVDAVTVGSIGNDVITAASIKADAITEIQGGLATGTDLATVDGIVDAIKLKTDSLNFTGTDVKATLDGEKVDVASIDNDAITAAAIKTDAVTEIQSGLATSLELASIDGLIDSIKAQTDLMKFTGNDIKATLDSETVTVGTNNDKSGYTLHADYDAAKTAASQTSVNTIDGIVDNILLDTAQIGVAGAGLTALGDTRIANLDAAVSTRMATFSYTAPDNASITSIKGVTDKIDDTLELDTDVYRFTLNALENAPTGDGGGGFTETDRTNLGTIKTTTDKINFNANDDVIASIDGETVDVSSIGNNVITAASINSDAITELQAGLATSVDLGTVDTVVDAIKAKTDNLPSDPASNTQVNTRMATFTYTAPDNASIGSIKAKTDQLTFSSGDVVATLNGETVTASSVTDKTGYALTAAYDAAKTAATQTSVNTVDGIVDAIKAKTDALPADPASNTVVNTRLATVGYTAPDNASITAIKAKTDNLSFTGTDVKATLDGETVTAATVSDKTGYALTAAYDAAKTAATQTSLDTVDGIVDAIKSKTDNLPADPASNTQVNTRMETFVYTAPDNASIADIKAQTDQLTFSSGDVVATLNGETVTASSVTDKTGYTLTEDYDAAKTAATQSSLDTVDGIVDAVKAKTDNLPADPASTTDVNTRMESFTYTAPDNDSITAIKAKTDNLSFTGTDVKATLDGETVTASTVSDKTGYALTAAYDAAKTAATQTSVNTVDGIVDSIKAKTDNLPADPASNTQVATRLASTSYTAPDNSSITAIKAKTDQLAFSSGDVIATLNGETVTTSSVTDKTGYYLANDAISSATVAASAVTEIQSGLATSSALSTVDTVVDAIKAKTDNLPSDPASNTVVNTRLAATSYTAPDNSSITDIKERTDLIPDDLATETSLSGIEDKIDTLQSSVETGNSDTPTVEEIVAGVLSGIVDGDITLKDAQERILACLINNSEVSRIESDTYFNHYNTAGTEVVIQQKVDVEGNREIIT